MKKLNTIIMVFIAVMLTACSNQTVKNVKEETLFQYTSYLENMNLEHIQNAETFAETAIDISDVAKLRDFHTNVFVGTIASIDGCSTTVATGEFVSMPQTYGKISVLENLKGNMPSDTITFARGGGIISVADYEKNAPDELIANHEKHRNQEIDKEHTYYHFFYNDDITIEAGKTYVFFGSFEQTGVFQIDGMKYGSREVVEPSTNQSAFRTMPQESVLQLKNNATGEYESFEAFKNLYFQ